MSAKRKRGDITNNDPHIRWVFEEADVQALSMYRLARRAGLGLGTLAGWRYRHNPSLAAFKAVLHVLGYEVMIVAKEPHDVAP